MKKIILPFLLLLIGSFAAAQSFSVNTNSRTHTIEANSRVLDDTVAVTNLTANQITLEWEKTVVSAPSSWSIWVCSDLSCYPPSTNGGTWDLSGNGHGDLSLHVNPGTETGSGEVHLKLWNTQDTTDSQTIIFTIDALTGITEFIVDPFVLYPNPVKNQVNISWEHMSLTDATMEVVSLQGQVLKSASIVDGAHFMVMGVEDLAPGVYMTRITDDSGTVFVRKFIKE